MNNLLIILEYLEKREKLDLEKQLKENKKKIDREDEQTIIDRVEKKFYFDNWVISASKRAKHYSILTHNCKYGHPSAKSSPIYYSPDETKDKSSYGLLISGLIDVEDDAGGSASSMDDLLWRIQTSKYWFFK
jgi:hypothetical protein